MNDESKPKFDLSFLNKISGGDQDFILDMINTFKEQVTEYIDNVTQYIEENNLQGLSRTAHKFLPGVSFLGIQELEKDVALIEEYAKKETNVEELPNLVQTSIEKVLAVVDSFNKEFNLE